jgi:RNA polymerase sigma factor (TIGR02999 family)
VGDQSNQSVTQLLREVAAGDPSSMDALLQAVYDDLHGVAARAMQRERADHTLQATALVHEAYLKLIDQHAVAWNDRAHFFAVAARVIRRILVDHARGHGREKRGGGWQRLTLHEASELMSDGAGEVDLLAVDQALEQLARISELQARVVEMRFFGGLTIPEIAEVLSMGKRSVDREWACAKAWLYRELSTGDAPADGDAS